MPSDQGKPTTVPSGGRQADGYVLYTGQQTLPFGGKIKAVPMDAL